MSFISSAILKALVSDCHNSLTNLQILNLQKGSSFFFVTILLGKSLQSINCDSKVLQVPSEHPTSSVKLKTTKVWKTTETFFHRLFCV